MISNSNVFGVWFFLGTCLGSQHDNRNDDDDSCLAAKFSLIRMASKAADRTKKQKKKTARKVKEEKSWNSGEMFNESSSLC